MQTPMELKLFSLSLGASISFSWFRSIDETEDRVVSCSSDWSVIVWDVARGIPITSFVGDTRISCVTAVGDLIVAGSYSCPVHTLQLMGVDAE